MRLSNNVEEVKSGLTSKTWTDWTPTITNDGGFGPASLTKNFANYYVLGKICYVTLNYTITNSNGAQGALLFTLPFTAQDGNGAAIAVGRESAITGKLIYGSLVTASNSLRMVGHDNVNGGIITTNYILVFSGSFRLA